MASYEFNDLPRHDCTFVNGGQFAVLATEVSLSNRALITVAGNQYERALVSLRNVQAVLRIEISEAVIRVEHFLEGHLTAIISEQNNLWLRGEHF